MKKISVLHPSSDVPWWREKAIFVVMRNNHQNYIHKVISSDGQRVVWAFDTYSFAIRTGDNIVDPNLFWTRFLDAKISKKDFFLQIKEAYPDDFMFFLWHPEVEFGEWDRKI